MMSLQPYLGPYPINAQRDHAHYFAPNWSPKDDMLTVSHGQPWGRNHTKYSQSVCFRKYIIDFEVFMLYAKSFQEHHAFPDNREGPEDMVSKTSKYNKTNRYKHVQK